MKKFLFPAALAVSAILLVAGARAHHAFAAEFDADKRIDVKGVVTKVRLVNPHSWLYLDVKNTDGSTTNWGVELAAPSALAARAWAKTDLKPGTEVHVKGYAAKNGGPYGYAVTTTLPDGRVFQTGGAQDTPAPPTRPGRGADDGSVPRTGSPLLLLAAATVACLPLRRRRSRSRACPAASRISPASGRRPVPPTSTWNRTRVAAMRRPVPAWWKAEPFPIKPDALAQRSATSSAAPRWIRA